MIDRGLTLTPWSSPNGAADSRGPERGLFDLVEPFHETAGVSPSASSELQP